MLLLLIFVVLARFSTSVSDNTSDKQSQDHQLNKLIADDELSQSIYKEVDMHSSVLSVSQLRVYGTQKIGMALKISLLLLIALGAIGLGSSEEGIWNLRSDILAMSWNKRLELTDETF